MRLEWSSFAVDDRNAIFDFIEADSLRAAAAIDERFDEQIEWLLRFPEMGRVGRVKGTRELVVRNTPYIVAYRVTGSAVRILHILHGAQRWPEEIPEGTEQP